MWFGLTWSLELYQQMNARLWRQGQKHTCLLYTSQIEEAKHICSDPVFSVEQKVDLSFHVKDCFGTADMVIVTDKKAVSYTHLDVYKRQQFISTK